MPTDLSFQGQLRSKQQTHELAEMVARQPPMGCIIGLNGPLGAGKTEFVTALGRCLGIGDTIKSPTFVLECVYEIPAQTMPGACSLHHWDLYRMPSGVEDLELFDFIGDPSRMLLVEWSERLSEDLHSLRIQLDLPTEPGDRRDTALAERRLLTLSIDSSLPVARSLERWILETTQ